MGVVGIAIGTRARIKTTTTTTTTTTRKIIIPSIINDIIAMTVKIVIETTKISHHEIVIDQEAEIDSSSDV